MFMITTLFVEGIIRNLFLERVVNKLLQTVNDIRDAEIGRIRDEVENGVA